MRVTDRRAPSSAMNMSDWVSHGSPWVPRKSSAALAGDERHPPLDQLIEGAEGQRDTKCEKAEHLSWRDEAQAEQDLPCQQRGRHTLNEMAELVIGIAAEVEPFLHPESRWYPRVGVGAAEDQDQRMNGDHHVEQSRQRQALVAPQQQGRSDQYRSDFQQPGGTVIRSDRGASQRQQHYQPQR